VVLRWYAVIEPTSMAGLGALFRSESSGIFGYLLLRCGSRVVAEDLTSQTFVAASRHIAAGRGDEVTPAWLQTVAKRRLVDHWRSMGSHRRRVERLSREPQPVGPPPGDPDDRVERALAGLPERQRAALVLRHVDEFSVSEIAELLGLSYKATESVLSRARRSFAAAFEETADA
jgi:RNA polymerase sigma-70 factor (ECF subfamily)